MDLVKIGFQINANGLKDANVEVDKLLTKVTRVSSKSINLKVKLDNSIQTVKKTLSDVEKIKNNLSALNIKVSMVGYSQVKANLEKLEALKKSVKDIQVRFTTIGNVNKIRDDFLKLKNKIITVKVVTSTAQLDNLKKKLDSIRDKTVKLNINLPKSSEVEKLGKALDKLTSKKVKIEVTITPDLTTVKEYANALDRIRSSRTTTTTNLGGGTGGSGGRSPAGAFDQVIGIAKYALLSTAIYGVMTATTNLAVATVKMADEYTAIQNRMKLYVTDAQELTKVNAQLAQFSIANNVGLRETSTLFTRLAPAMQKIGANTAAVTSVVDAFGKSLRIGGATAQEAASATIQFSQAMASGKLAGDEFRSISEASPRFLQAIAEGSGIAADQLKKMSAAGMLTTEVISKALLNEYPKLIEENKKLGITLEQGANALKTGFLVAFGEFNEGAGITKALGESMANLAQSMLTAAQGARQFGADVKKWFKDNADTIQTVVDAFQLLATVIASRYVAAIVLARIETLKLTYQTSALAAAQTASMRSFVIGATVVTAFGRAAQTAFAFMGGWAGIALTIAGVATSYLLLRDNAAEANKKLEEQSVYLNKTTEDFKELNAEQMKNAQFKIKVDMEEANKNIEKAKNEYLNFLRTLATKPKMTGFDLNFTPRNNDAAELINSAEKGTKSFDAVTASIIEQGVATTEQNKKLLEFNDRYVKAATSGINMAKTAKAVGVDSEISGNKMQNAAIQAQLLGNGYSDVGDKADIAGGKVRKFYQDLQTDTKKNILAFDLSNKLNVSPSTANKVADELSNRAAQEEGLKNKELINQYQKLVKLQTDLSAAQVAFSSKKNRTQDETKLLREQRLEVEKQRQLYRSMKASNPYVKVNPSSLLTPEDTKTIKAYDASTSLFSNQTKADKEADKARKKQEADAQRAANANQKIVDKYDNQEAIAIRLNEYLKAGVAYSVAKVASEGKYAKVYGYNLETARKIAKARQEVADIEESSKGREDSQNSLRKQFRDQQAIGDFMKEGYSYAVAQATVQSGFAVNADGIANANNRILISLRDQLTISEAESSYQQDLLDFVKSGLSVEEASAKVAIYRNQHLNKSLIIAAEELAKAKQTEQVTKSQLALELESNSYKEQATYLVQTTNNELADIMTKHKGVLLQEAQTLQTRKDIVEKLREYNDLLEKQKSLTSVIESTNFEVFGDFGNPFKSALEGLNSLLFGMSDLEAKYQRMGADLTARIDKEKKGSEAQNLLIAQKADLELAHIQESKQARDKAITSGLSITKSLFKEESKGYKVVSGLEKAYQASKIAFALWEKKDTIAMLALSLKAHITDALGFTTGAAAKLAAQQGVNIAKGTEIIMNQGSGDPYTAFPRMAAMAAAVAALGVAIGSFSGSGGGEYVDTSNQGTGTVFGDSEAQSASIANSIDLLSENSDLMLPLTSAMLRSLKNIESSIGGVTNLILRGDLGGDFSNLEFDARLTGVIGTANSLFVKFTNGLEKVLTGGLLSKVGIGGLGSSIVSSIVGGLFGKTSQEVVASGLYAGDQKLSDILSNGINLKQYADVKTTKKSLLGSSSSTRTQYASVDEELQRQFTLIFGGFYDSILSATDILGADLSTVENNLKNAVVSIGKINLKGLSGEQIQEKLTAVFGAAADDIARAATNEVTYVTKTVQQPIKTLFGKVRVGYREVTQTVAVVTNVFDDFQKVGEGFFETVVRVATGVEQAAYFTDRLNVTAIKYVDIINKQGDVAAEIVRQSVLLNESTKDIKGGFYDLVNSFDGTAEELTDFVLTLRDLQDQLFMTGKNADYLTSAMILGAGGLDSLASGLDAYFEMLSPAEQAAELTRRLTNEFAIFGKELPADVKAFRKLVSSIDITTEAGQKLYGQIIALAPEFNDLQDALDSANSEVNALVQSLRDLAEQARAARGETEQPRNLAYTRSQFEQASVLAMQGDIASAEKLLTLGKDLMDLSKTYSVTGSEYARDLALIQRAATVSADIQEQGLGTSISTTLTPSSGSTTNPTVNTNTTSTDAKLDALSEKLEAGLFAIAKYTQDSASRLERWDDGGRMMVGIQPENGDAPVPVVVTP